MKLTKVIFGIAVLALGIASAATTYKVTLTGARTIGTTQLKAGEYKVEMQGDKAVFTSGGTSVEVAATLGKNERKYSTTAILTKGSSVFEIDLGGTTDKILFSAASAGQTAGGSK